MTKKPLTGKPVYTEGREVNRATFWWLQNTDYPRRNLACTHNKLLTEACKTCNSFIQLDQVSP